MDMNTFELFLESQRGGFETFLRGCQELDRKHVRIALDTHTQKMTFTLTTALPILGIGPDIASAYDDAPHRSATRSVTTPSKSPVAFNLHQDQIPPASSRFFKSPGAIPEIPSLFKHKASTVSATPVSTPKSKKSADPESASKVSPYCNFRTSSGGARSILRGGTMGGAGRIFKPAPRTPTGKRYVRDGECFHISLTAVSVIGSSNADSSFSDQMTPPLAAPYPPTNPTASSVPPTSALLPPSPTEKA